MKTKDDVLKAIAISMMVMNILMVMLAYIYVKQTNTMIEQNEKLLNIEYSKCTNEMHEVGDRCSK